MIFALGESVQQAVVAGCSAVAVAGIGLVGMMITKRETQKVSQKLGDPNTDLSSQMDRMQASVDDLHHGYVSIAERLAGVERTQISHTGELNQMRKVGVEICAKLTALEEKTTTQGVTIWDHETRIVRLEKITEKVINKLEGKNVESE